eukprot:430533_1
MILKTEDIQIKIDDMYIIDARNNTLNTEKTSMTISFKHNIDSHILLNQKSEPNIKLNINIEKLNIIMTQQHCKDILMILNSNELQMDAFSHELNEEEANGFTSMVIKFNIKQLKFGLCENANKLPFCEFSVVGTETRWNRQCNGDFEAHLEINEMQLIQQNDEHSKQYKQLICPFNKIQSIVQHSLSIDEEKQLPFITFSYQKPATTSALLVINEPCIFLLPSFIKRLKSFFNINWSDKTDIAGININKSNLYNDIRLEMKLFLSNWISNIKVNVNDARFIFYENPNILNTNAVVLNTSVSMRRLKLITDEMDNHQELHTNMDINLDSIQAFVCPAIQISNCKHKRIQMHTIIYQKTVKCNVSSNKIIDTNTNNTISKIIEINCGFRALIFTISFADIHIFGNIAKSLQNTIEQTFSNNKQLLSLKDRVSSLIPVECNLKDHYAKLHSQGFEAELCFEALLHHKQLDLAAQYCCENAEAFEIRKCRGEINQIFDLLPANMYHSFKQLSTIYDEKEVIRALVISNFQLDKAKQLLIESINPLELQNNYEEEKHIIEDYTENIDEQTQENIDVRMHKNVQMHIVFTSEIGITVHLINDVISSHTVPFIRVTLYSMQLLSQRLNEEIKGTFNFDAQAKLYNPTVICPEPLLESSRVTINWNSIISDKSMNWKHIINVGLQGIPHEQNALVPKVIPINVNITHYFAKTLLATIRAWNHFAATQRNRNITSWKPFYVVNKTGICIEVWLSDKADRKQKIFPQEISPLTVGVGVTAALAGNCLKYNRLQISFRLGDYTFEQISVAQNRRRKITHKKENVCVVIQTLCRNGTKFVYIWSPTEIRNHTSGPLRIKLYYNKRIAIRCTSFELEEGDTIDDEDSKKSEGNINCLDFGVVQPGSSVTVPFVLKSLECHISFKPVSNDGWIYTKLQKIGDLIKTNKFTLIRSTWKSNYPVSTPQSQLIKCFFIRPLSFTRDLITIIIQSPLMVTNLFPFPMTINLKTDGIQNFRVKQHIAMYQSIPITTDLKWGKWEELKIKIDIDGFGASKWVGIPDSDNIEPMPINIESADCEWKIFLENRICKVVPIFRDDSTSTLAMRSIYFYTKYLFINKLGLELEIKTPKKQWRCPQMEFEIEVFENQRKNAHEEWVLPFQPFDVPSQCDRTYKSRDRHNILLPNTKWKWKSNWKVSGWKYASDFNCPFHQHYDAINDDQVRRRIW